MGTDEKMTKEEILKQLPDDFKKLRSLAQSAGPPTDEYQGAKYQTVVRTFFDRFNPFVPLGLAATVYFLGNGLRHMVLRNTYKSQLMMRGRVIAQAFTVIALAGGMLYESRRNKPKEKF